jgi:hypothetical protein
MKPSNGTAADDATASARLPAGSALTPIGFGELIDKISILEIKRDRISDPQKNANVRLELKVLDDVLAGFALPDGFSGLKGELRRINETLWELEDQVRECEREKNFGPVFIEAARSIYKTNDRRAALKRELNELVGSSILEEKSYEESSRATKIRR